VKGHGTENDFVVIDDQDGQLELSESLVRALCDRHAGVGADGVLRVVRSANDAEGAEMADRAPFFMDYRNADGSRAEMCGNGARVFYEYLRSAGLVDGATAIGTRGGVRPIWGEPDGSITVGMGAATVLDTTPKVAAHGSGRTFAGCAIQVPNPHVVVMLSTDAELAALDLTVAPQVDPPLPHGQNVEFVVVRGPRHIALRVHERGVGETRSCGTGICAAVVASAGAGGADGESWLVDVPGGQCQVRWQTDGEILLTGPAVLVGAVELSDEWLDRVTMEAR
jgi:diaminopimelate epimerase